MSWLSQREVTTQFISDRAPLCANCKVPLSPKVPSVYLGSKTVFFFFSSKFFWLFFPLTPNILLTSDRPWKMSWIYSLLRFCSFSSCFAASFRWYCPIPSKNEQTKKKNKKFHMVVFIYRS